MKEIKIKNCGLMDEYIILIGNPGVGKFFLNKSFKNNKKKQIK